MTRLDNILTDIQANMIADMLAGAMADTADTGNEGIVEIVVKRGKPWGCRKRRDLKFAGDQARVSLNTVIGSGYGTVELLIQAGEVRGLRERIEQLFPDVRRRDGGAPCQ